MKILLSHSGKQHSYHLAKALNDLGMLKAFYTSSYVKNKKLQAFFNNSDNKFFTKRFIDGLSGNTIHTNWSYEFKEFFIRKVLQNAEAARLAVCLRDEKFDNHISKIIGKTDADMFWGFQGSCHQCLKTANKKQLITVVELASVHIETIKKILTDEANLHPEWAESIDNIKLPLLYEQRLQEEPLIAQKVVVASVFSQNSLIDVGIEKSKVEVIQLGFDANLVKYNKNFQDVGSRKLKVLFVGRITQGKGIKYLLEAVSKLSENDFELHIIGTIQGSETALKQYKKYYTLHKPCTQKELYTKYSEFDVLVSPSLIEGFGFVILEALASGLPVIATTNSIAPEIIKNGINGYIVPIRNSAAIQIALEKIKSLNNHNFNEMRKTARESVQAFSWNSHKKRVNDFVNSLI